MRPDHDAPQLAVVLLLLLRGRGGAYLRHCAPQAPQPSAEWAMAMAQGPYAQVAPASRRRRPACRRRRPARYFARHFAKHSQIRGLTVFSWGESLLRIHCRSAGSSPQDVVLETIFRPGLRRREPFLKAMAFPRQMASSPRFCGPSLPRTGVPLITSHQAATTAPAGVSRTQGAGR
jgi:hypothetical protein